MQPAPSKFLSLVLLASLVALACSSVTAADEAASTAAQLQTEKLKAGEPGNAVMVLDFADPSNSLVVGTAALGGLETYDLGGKRLGSTPAGDVAAVDVIYDVPLDSGPATVLASIDTTDNSLRLFAMRSGKLEEVGARALPLGFAGEGVCLYRHHLDGAVYAFVVGDGGEIDQHVLFAVQGGKLDARQVRRINVPSSLKQCVASSEGTVYASEETVGIWRFNADPEADVLATLVDTPHLGHLDEEASGVALYDGGDGSRWLIVADESGGRVNFYNRSDDDKYVGAVVVAAPGGESALEEPGPLFATSAALGKSFPSGVLLVADEEGANFKLVSIADLAAALKLDPGKPQDPRRGAGDAIVVTASAETVSARSYGDAADDPAIWAHPTDPTRSLVIATDKKGGVYVYDMQGKELQFLPDGKMNNIDLRNGYALGSEKVTLVTASDRTRRAIAIYRLDPEARRLMDVADGVQPTGLKDPYGLCMYQNPASGKTYVFINSGDGPMHQWELVDTGKGKVATRLVREFAFETQTEGCVVDDAAGALYVGEEDIALWRMKAEPDGGTDKTAVQRVADNPAIKDDLEGVGLYDLGDGRGYLVVSSQGNDTYAVYRREGANEYVGSFSVVGDAHRGIDGVSETDGLDVNSGNLGPGFEHGAMVAQDGRNVLPVENQNYKFVSWSAIAKALKLESRSD